MRRQTPLPIVLVVVTLIVAVVYGALAAGLSKFTGELGSATTPDAPSCVAK